MQVDAHSAEYRPFTKEGAARVAKEFEISEQRDVLFNIVGAMTQSYERYKQLPDHRQMKDALSDLSAAIAEVASIARQYDRQLRPPLEGSVLRLLGELLTYEALERLTGRTLSKTHPVATRFQPADPDANSLIERSVFAAQAGPSLLIALLEQLKGSIDDMLDKGKEDAGGRPTKHLYRHMIMYELARNHAWFFGKAPTSTTTGHYARFCKAVLEELECDMTGFYQALPRVLNDIGIFPKRQAAIDPGAQSAGVACPNPPSRRMGV